MGFLQLADAVALSVAGILSVDVVDGAEGRERLPLQGVESGALGDELGIRPWHRRLRRP